MREQIGLFSKSGIANFRYLENKITFSYHNKRK